MSEDKNSGNTIRTKKLGLAAYLVSNGVHLREVTTDKFFVFESERNLQLWQIEYTNSCCSKHDACLCELRKMISNKQSPN